jgi:hypothetical protein
VSVSRAITTASSTNPSFSMVRELDSSHGRMDGSGLSLSEFIIGLDWLINLV